MTEQSANQDPLAATAEALAAQQQALNVKAAEIQQRAQLADLGQSILNRANESPDLAPILQGINQGQIKSMEDVRRLLGINETPSVGDPIHQPSDARTTTKLATIEARLERLAGENAAMRSKLEQEKLGIEVDRAIQADPVLKAITAGNPVAASKFHNYLLADVANNPQLTVSQHAQLLAATLRTQQNSQVNAGFQAAQAAAQVVAPVPASAGGGGLSAPPPEKPLTYKETKDRPGALRDRLAQMVENLKQRAAAMSNPPNP